MNWNRLEAYAKQFSASLNNDAAEIAFNRFFSVMREMLEREDLLVGPSTPTPLPTANNDKDDDGA